MKLLLAVAGAAVAAVVTAQPCAACSCAPGDPRAMLRGADAAFVGVLVKKEIKNPPVRSSGDRAIYTFRVEEQVKGRLGSTVAAESAVSGATCGLEVGIGDRAGVLLERANGVWTSSLCSQLSPSELRAAARPLPKPTGRGRAALVVAGGFGEARTIALDARGRTIAYGRGRGATLHLAACPGGRRVVELVVGDFGTVAGRSRVRMVVRSLPGMRRVRDVSLPHRLLNLHKQEVRAFGCFDAAARDVLVFARRTIEGVPSASVLFRVAGADVSVRYKGFARSAALSRHRAYLADGPGGTHLVAFDLRTRKRGRVGTLPVDAQDLTISRDGRYVAGFVTSKSRIVVVRLADGARRTRALGGRQYGGTLAWSRGRLLYLPAPTGDGYVFDASLRPIARVRKWSGVLGAVIGTRVYGISSNGGVVAGPLPRGPVRSLRQLPGRSVYAVAGVGVG